MLRERAFCPARLSRPRPPARTHDRKLRTYTEAVDPRPRPFRWTAAGSAVVVADGALDGPRAPSRTRLLVGIDALARRHGCPVGRWGAKREPEDPGGPIRPRGTLARIPKGVSNVPNGTSEVRTALVELMEANAAARSLLRDNARLLSRALRLLDAGVEVPAVLDQVPVDAPRLRSNEVFDRLTHARHTLRIVVIGECLDAGFSIGDLGRRWGFSRQLAARYAKEWRNR